MAANKKKIISNIVFYTVLALIYLIAAFSVITKFTGGTVYIANTRMDVVLTDSMSVRNENHADFLADTTQIQAFDIVISDKINENTELKVKDCVLFKNPNYYNETVVHRIVNITEEGTAFKVINCDKRTFNNEELIYLDYINGEISMAAIDYSKIEIVSYSSEIAPVFYVISEGPNPVDTKVTSTLVKEGVYKNVITYERDSRAPRKTFISPGTDKDQYIASITYTSDTNGEYKFTASELVVDTNHSYSKLFNPYYLYEIRADKSNSADGIFERDALISKVTAVVPKLGHVIHFIQSIPGLITLIGLAIIISLASFFWTKSSKKEAQEVVENADNVIENQPPVIEEAKIEIDNTPPETDKKDENNGSE